jgi:hypothetical protein
MEFLPKIPAFIHVPRTGGTYIYNANKVALRFFLEKMCYFYPDDFNTSNDFRFVYKKGDKFPIIEVNLKLDNDTIATIFYTQKKNNDLAEQYKLKKVQEYIFEISCDDSRIKLFLDSIDIFSIIIQPCGLRFLKNNLFQELFRECANLSFYLPMRDPVERLKSLFFYLKSDKSIHEPSYGVYKSNTFEEFIINEAPDNWCVNQLSGAPKSEKICKLHFGEAKLLLENLNVLFFDIKNIDKMLDYAFKRYKFSFLKEIPNNFKDFLLKFNQNNKNEWSYKCNFYSEEIQKEFVGKLNEKTEYDYKLFNLIKDY